jgi:hypothetical protein
MEHYQQQHLMIMAMEMIMENDNGNDYVVTSSIHIPTWMIQLMIQLIILSLIVIISVFFIIKMSSISSSTSTSSTSTSTRIGDEEEEEEEVEGNENENGETILTTARQEEEEEEEEEDGRNNTDNDDDYYDLPEDVKEQEGKEDRGSTSVAVDNHSNTDVVVVVLDHHQDNQEVRNYQQEQGKGKDDEKDKHKHKDDEKEDNDGETTTIGDDHNNNNNNNEEEEGQQQQQQQQLQLLREGEGAGAEVGTLKSDVFFKSNSKLHTTRSSVSLNGEFGNKSTSENSAAAKTTSAASSTAAAAAAATTPSSATNSTVVINTSTPNISNNRSYYRTGKWTKEENMAFFYGIRIYGKGQWKKIADDFIPTRAVIQTKSRGQAESRKTSGFDFSELDKYLNENPEFARSLSSSTSISPTTTKGVEGTDKREKLQYGTDVVVPSSSLWNNKIRTSETGSQSSQRKHKLGTKTIKNFDGQLFLGSVNKYSSPYYKILYEDGDEEDLTHAEVTKLLFVANEEEEKEEEANIVEDISTAKISIDIFKPKTKITKEPYRGWVNRYDHPYYRVEYENGDEEDLTHVQVSNYLSLYEASIEDIKNMGENTTRERAKRRKRKR